MSETCKISVHAGWGSPIPNASVLKLRVEIDGTVHEPKWGDSEFAVTPGSHEVRIYYWHPLYKNRMIRSATIDVEPGSPCTLRYSLQTGFANCRAFLEVNGQPDPEGGTAQSDSQLRTRWLLLGLILPFTVAYLVTLVDWSPWVEIGLLTLSASFLIIYVMVNRRNSQPAQSG